MGGSPLVTVESSPVEGEKGALGELLLGASCARWVMNSPCWLFLGGTGLRTVRGAIVSSNGDKVLQCTTVVGLAFVSKDGAPGGAERTSRGNKVSESTT